MKGHTTRHQRQFLWIKLNHAAALISRRRSGGRHPRPGGCTWRGPEGKSRLKRPSPFHRLSGALLPFPCCLRQRKAGLPPAPSFGLGLRVTELQVGTVPITVLKGLGALPSVLRCRFGPEPLFGRALLGQFVSGPQVLSGPHQVNGCLFEGPAEMLHGWLLKAAPVQSFLWDVLATGCLTRPVLLSHQLLQQTVAFGPAAGVPVSAGRVSLMHA